MIRDLLISIAMMMMEGKSMRALGIIICAGIVTTYSLAKLVLTAMLVLISFISIIMHIVKALA